MATTFRQVLNKVLNRLGEEEISGSTTTLSDDYHILLAAMVNDVKEEIEEAALWRTLWHDETVTVAASTTSIAITNTNERSRHVRVNEPAWGQEVGLCFDYTDTSNATRINEMELAMIKHRQTVDDDEGDDVNVYAIDDSVAADTLLLQVWPAPKADFDIRITMCTPQAELAIDALDTAISIPERPLRLGVLWTATEERGEELGANGLFTEQRYRIALDDAVARDMGAQGDLELIPA
jgi:hypothetical protein